MDDVELLRRYAMDGSEEAAAKAGDLAAFDLLMRQYERLVLVTALRLLGRLEDAQDASQEVFLRLYKNLNKVGPRATFRDGCIG